MPTNEDSQVEVGEGDASGEEADTGSKKKKKAPSVTRLMKNRLQKLVSKKDAE